MGQRPTPPVFVVVVLAVLWACGVVLNVLVMIVIIVGVDVESWITTGHRDSIRRL